MSNRAAKHKRSVRFGGTQGIDSTSNSCKSSYTGLRTGYNMYLPSKKDPELSTETRDVKYKYPFALSTNNTKPIRSRFLMSLRTTNDFNDPNKLSSDNTVEAMLERER